MRKYIIALLFILVGISLTGCDFGKEEEYKYKLTLYNLNEIESVTIDTMSQYDSNVQIEDKSTIKVVYYIFEGKTTNEESDGDNPTDAGKMYKVTFNTEKESKSVYIYSKGDSYYLDNPNYGKYESNEEDFQKLEKIVKDNTYAFTLKNFSSDEIMSVTVSDLGQYSSPVELKERKDIRILYNIFNAKKTNTASDDYNPTNHGELYHVIFTNNSYETKDFYIYQKNEKYYIEEALYAIFDSNESEFEIVEKYVESGKKEEK